jgi:uracil-DNA glycosylase
MRKSAMSSSTGRLLREVRACTLCTQRLPLGPRPVLQLHPDATILIAGQAPGRKVHASGVPFQDASGDRLRDWMGIDAATFYDAKRIALLPMGFCYPGTGASGDLPPRPECALAWHLGERQKGTLTETVQVWRQYGPDHLPLPHPSPRNNIWLRRNPWFADEVVPRLRRRVRALMA